MACLLLVVVVVLVEVVVLLLVVLVPLLVLLVRLLLLLLLLVRELLLLLLLGAPAAEQVAVMKRPASVQAAKCGCSRLPTITTQVVATQGFKVLYLDEKIEPCICVTLLAQNQSHGNCEMPTDWKSGLPICHGIEKMSEVELARYCHAMFETYGCIAAQVGSREEWRQSCDLWGSDMAVTNGLARGLPNSQAWGIMRAHGVAYGKCANFLRSLPLLKKLWRAACTAYGREPLGPETEWLTCFDGTLATTTSHRYRGLDLHKDVELGEPGHITALTVLHPPPEGYRRVGQAIQWYKNTLPLWRMQAVGLLTKWSMSPDMDLRTTPYPNLGSGGHQGDVLGGEVMSKTEALVLSDEELEKAVTALPPYLQETLPPRPVADDRTNAQWLIDHGWVAALPPHRDIVSPRVSFMQALASDMNDASARHWFSSNITVEGRMVLEKARKFSAPEKIKLWEAAGGRQGRRKEVILQPSGAVGKKRKENGNRKALSANMSKARKK